MSEQPKKDGVPESQPSYEDDEALGQTMMDIDLKKFDSESISEPTLDQIPPQEKQDPVGSPDTDIDEMLRKKKSIMGKIKGLFSK